MLTMMLAASMTGMELGQLWGNQHFATLLIANLVEAEGKGERELKQREEGQCRLRCSRQRCSQTAVLRGGKKSSKRLVKHRSPVMLKTKNKKQKAAGSPVLVLNGWAARHWSKGLDAMVAVP